MASTIFLDNRLSLPGQFPLPTASSHCSYALSPSLSFLRLLRHPCKTKKVLASSGSVRQPRAAEEGLPTDIVEDSKFVPLSADDPQFGPPALLLLGFKTDEVVQIQEILKEIDGEFLQIILCTEEMTTLSLWDAINTPQSSYLEGSKIAEALPRICFMSGLTGEEMLMFIDVFPEAGLEPTVFAAVVPNSASKPLLEVVEEIMGDHEMLSQKNP